MSFNLRASLAVSFWPKADRSSESEAARLRSRSYKAGMCRTMRFGSTSSVDSGMTARVCVASECDVCYLDTNLGEGGENLLTTPGTSKTMRMLESSCVQDHAGTPVLDVILGTPSGGAFTSALVERSEISSTSVGDAW